MRGYRLVTSVWCLPQKYVPPRSASPRSLLLFREEFPITIPPREDNALVPRPVVVFNCARNYEPGSIEHDFPRMVAACEIRLTEAKDGPDLAAVLEDADVLIARRDYVGPATLDLARNLKGIVTPGVGVEKVDV